MMTTARLHAFAWLSISTLWCCMSSAEEPATLETGWSTIHVPAAWEEDAEGRFKGHDGFAWYRCYVKIPDSWRDSLLYADSLVLAINNVSAFLSRRERR